MSEPSSQERTPAASEFEDLLVEALGVLEDGGSAAFEALIAQRPEHAEALRRRIAELGRLGLVDSSALAGAPRAERMGDFRLVRELGGGGMGVVYEAIQESLGRRVALKLIRPELLWFGGSRARFRREIEAVARLSHPGIVPIFTVGEETGVPFFAMELIEGCTLAQAMAHLAGRPVSKLTGADLLAAIARCSPAVQDSSETSHSLGFSPDANWTEVAIRVVRQIAEALEHAHSRGVVHRDVKPSNVVMTRTGRAMLIDFGLATREGSERITRSGSAGGSVAYMSPEQVRGEAADARTDVYSLGVSFAELLTLHPVFEGKSVDVLWRSILEGTYVRPRQRVPAIPWDVETVCTTAMDTARERRYASAGDLARDLSNLLARRPIDARRAGPMLRGLRWAQRHPRLSASLLAGSALALVGALFYGRQQSVLGKEIRTQRDVAQARADELRRLATAFVFDVHEEIKRLPGSTQACEQMVTQAQALFDSLARAQADDPSLARDLAFAELRLGSMLDRTKGGTLGQSGSAGEHLERGWAWFDQHARAEGTSLEDRRLLVEAQTLLGKHLTSNGDPERGARILLRGIEDSRALVALPEATLGDQIDSIWLDLELAFNRAHLGRTAEARELYETAVAHLEEQERRQPGEVLVLRPMPRAYLLLADACEHAGQIELARDRFRAGVAAGDRLLELEPVPPGNRRSRAHCLEGLGGTLTRLGAHAEAREVLALALADYRMLQREDPRDVEAVLDIVRVHSNASEACMVGGLEEEGLAHVREALAAIDSLARTTKGREVQRRRLTALLCLADVESDLGLHEEGREHFRAAAAAVEELDREDPQDLFVVAAAAQVLREWASLEEEAGEAQASLDLHRRAIVAYERWLELSPEHLLARTESAFERTLLAKALDRQGLDAESLEQHRRACAESEAHLDGDADDGSSSDATFLERGAFTLLEGGLAIGEGGDWGEARRLYGVAWKWIERVLELDPEREMTRLYLEAAAGRLGEEALLRGADEEALAWARKSLERREAWAREQGAPPTQLVLVAKEYLEGEHAALRDPRKALELSRLALERAPDQVMPHYWMAKTLRANGEGAAALAEARQAAEMIPQPVDPAMAGVVAKLAAMIAELELAAQH